MQDPNAVAASCPGSMEGSKSCALLSAIQCRIQTLWQPPVQDQWKDPKAVLSCPRSNAGSKRCGSLLSRINGRIQKLCSPVRDPVQDPKAVAASCPGSMEGSKSCALLSAIQCRIPKLCVAQQLGEASCYCVHDQLSRSSSMPAADAEPLTTW